MSGIQLQDTVGLKCYRELIEREARCAYRWDQQFGKESLKEVRWHSLSNGGGPTYSIWDELRAGPELGSPRP